MAQKKQTRVIQVHDHAFRKAMSDLRVASDFLTHYLPTEVSEKMDWQSLALQKESYVDKELKLSITDMLYSVALKGEASKTAYVYLLLEHLSTQKRLTPWRMLQYTCQVIKEKLSTVKKGYLPLVIPLVVYNGNSPYAKPTSIYDLFEDAEKSLAKAYMFQQFQLVDFSQVQDEEIRQHRWSQLMELLLKHARSREAMNYLESLSETILTLAKEHADEYILSMLKYYIEVAEVTDPQRFTAFLQQSLPQSLEQQAMTLAQVWKNEGEQVGIQKGEEIGIQKGRQLGMQETLQVLDLLRENKSLEEIIKTTNASHAEILAIKKRLSH